MVESEHYSINNSVSGQLDSNNVQQADIRKALSLDETPWCHETRNKTKKYTFSELTALTSKPTFAFFSAFLDRIARSWLKIEPTICSFETGVDIWCFSLEKCKLHVTKGSSFSSYSLKSVWIMKPVATQSRITLYIMQNYLLGVKCTRSTSLL